MNTVAVALKAFGMGVIAGSRTMTAPAAVAWGARLGWLDVAKTPIAFMGSTGAVVAFTAGVIAESIGDQLPGTPARTVPLQFGARVLSGAFAGACIAFAAKRSGWLGGACGAIGAALGTVGGYTARTGLVRRLHVPDRAAGISEDAAAAGAGLLVAHA